MIDIIMFVVIIIILPIFSLGAYLGYRSGFKRAKHLHQPLTQHFHTVRLQDAMEKHPEDFVIPKIRNIKSLADLHAAMREESGDFVIPPPKPLIGPRWYGDGVIPSEIHRRA